MRKALPWVLLAAIVAFLAWKLRTSHFDWAGFIASIRTANVGLLALAVAIIYANNLVRAVRWAVFLKPAAKAAGRTPTRWYELIGTQFVGFTSLALFGRIGELIRPVLVARRTGYTVSSQIAVVAVERVFDLGAFAALFSLNLLLSPDLQKLPHHELFHNIGYVIALLTVVLGAFVAGVRLAGAAVARVFARLIGNVSKPAAVSAEEKILAFRDGLNVIDNAGDLLLATLLSLALWISIALSYVLTMKAFPAPVNGLSIADCLLLMGFSVAGNVVQLPGIGGGAQVLTISALTTLFSLPVALATSAGLMIWLLGSWAVVPAGLIYARVEGISLKQAARATEAVKTVAP